MWPTGGLAHVWVCPSVQTHTHVSGSSHQRSHGACTHVCMRAHTHGEARVRTVIPLSHATVRLNAWRSRPEPLAFKTVPGSTPGTLCGKPPASNSSLSSTLTLSGFFFYYYRYYYYFFNYYQTDNSSKTLKMWRLLKQHVQFRTFMFNSAVI